MSNLDNYTVYDPIDSEVHTTGDQTIEGVKTLYSTEQTRLQIRSARVGATQPIGGVQFQNSTGTPVSFFYARVNGETGVQLLGGTKAFFVLDQRAYNSANTDDVATIGTLDAYTPMMRTTGNQEISGIKTSTVTRGFNARVGNYGVGYNCTSPNDEYNVDAPQEYAYPYLNFDDKNGMQAAILRFTHNGKNKTLQFLIKGSDGNFHATNLAQWTDP